MSLSRLLQLASPMLPVGAYSYSQGLESAIESGEVNDAASAQTWIGEVLRINFVNFELPVLARLYQAWSQQDEMAIQYWDAFYRAGRDTAELFAESSQMANALFRLQRDLGEWPDDLLLICQQLEMPAFPTLYAASAWHWKINLNDALQVYCFSWLENQISAAMKTIPLGQVAGQRLISVLGEALPPLIEQALAIEDDAISNFCPALSIASCQHETQYSRLFRS